MFRELLCSVLYWWQILFFIRLLLSWFRIDPNGWMATIDGALRIVTDPVLKPVRKVMKPVDLGGTSIDLSPLVIIFALRWVVLPLLCR